MQPIKNLAPTMHGWQLEPIGKWLPLDIFCKDYFCNSNGFIIPSAFIFFLYSPTAAQKFSFNYLIMFQLFNV